MSVWFGSATSDSNVRLRMLLVVFGGVLCFSFLLYWRFQLLIASDYVEFPTHAKSLSNITLRHLEERGADSKLYETN